MFNAVTRIRQWDGFLRKHDPLRQITLQHLFKKLDTCRFDQERPRRRIINDSDIGNALDALHVIRWFAALPSEA
jgi:hypothetical protein